MAGRLRRAGAIVVACVALVGGLLPLTAIGGRAMPELGVVAGGSSSLPVTENPPSAVTADPDRAPTDGWFATSQIPSVPSTPPPVEHVTAPTGIDTAASRSDASHTQFATAIDRHGCAAAQACHEHVDEPVERPEPACTDPATCAVVESVDARWRCETPGCDEHDWIGAVIGWPHWSAHASNGRDGTSARSVRGEDGRLLHPYMGPWADGCTVTARTGTVLIIEWERGADVWRETRLEPGQSHTISLFETEDGAMIETIDGGESFSVELDDCEPAPNEDADVGPDGAGCDLATVTGCGEVDG